MRFAVPLRRLSTNPGKLVNNDFNKLIDHYSKFNPSPLSIKQFLEFGERANPVDSFSFLRKEVPVRLANIMKEIELLPPQLLSMPSVKMVASWYQMSFMEIAAFDKLNKGTPSESVLDKFTETLTKVRNRHNTVVQTMAEGVLELKQQQKCDVSTEHTIQYFLDRFYMSRISIRMLINQHTSLFGVGGRPSGNDRQVGVIDPHCDITSVCVDAFENAKFLCDQYYLTSPNMIQECIPKEPRIRIVYVPSHLYHILFELFKNAMRAVVEHHGADSDHLPELRVLIVQGKEDVTIKLSDLGGGIPRSASDLLFQYMYSTAPEPSSTNTAPLAGYGYGLPISRLYAKYLHGDLSVTSMEGYGTDAHVFIKAISKDSHEMLPIFNKTSSKHYNMVMGSNDWSSPMSASEKSLLIKNKKKQLRQLSDSDLRQMCTKIKMLYIYSDDMNYGCSAIIRFAVTLGAIVRIAASNQTRCYGSLGCFSTTGAFSDARVFRNFVSVLPWTRERIQATIVLFTRANRNKPDRILFGAINQTSLADSHFKAGKSLVVFAHGYLQLVSMDKTQLMIKDKFLDHQDCNFIFVDWSKGSVTGYWTATANTRVVGAEIAEFVNKIIKYYNFEKAKVHLVGHSLGSHIVGYAGARVQGISRLTALDPAEPFFQGGSPEIRIDPTDADFVEAFHTDSKSFWRNPVDGLGMWDPVGHVDVYVNGGLQQPACGTLEPSKIAVKFLNEKNPVILARDSLACHHQYVNRLVGGMFFRDGSCIPIAYQCFNFSDFLLAKCTHCGSDTSLCYEVGDRGISYRRFKDSAPWPKTFFILTNAGVPYCMHQYELRFELSTHTDVTEARISLVFEDVEGKLSKRVLLQNGQWRVSSSSRPASETGGFPQAWVVGVESTIKPQIRKIRLSWTSLDRNRKLSLASDSRIKFYYMNRIIPTE